MTIFDGLRHADTAEPRPPWQRAAVNAARRIAEFAVVLAFGAIVWGVLVVLP